MKKPRSGFVVSNYEILHDTGGTHLVIEGRKSPPPSKRITLHQADIKILNAKIIYKHKKGDIEFEVARVNRVKSFGEIRLHTNNILYPGIYEVTMDYTGELDEQKLNSGEL